VEEETQTLPMYPSQLQFVTKLLLKVMQHTLTQCLLNYPEIVLKMYTCWYQSVINKLPMLKGKILTLKNHDEVLDMSGFNQAKSDSQHPRGDL